jgi:hypothetical protein
MLGKVKLEWKSRTNQELEEMRKGENIVRLDKGAKDKLVWSPGVKWRWIGCPKRSTLKNWKGRDKGENPGKDGKRK